ncbi:hypothetical protein [Paenibacillus eucommiae]|uniref:Fructose-bisphosphate aldolase class 1 n=1 Tax=Paenibacillus eucommiae TaxID=1355755 RepID=A0ABS4J6M0_9BACL|nr:hypothetical protein [Paenibacillus eucommiae]MBP1995480.1 fructose-bisphosphate aldolase class 1 [Paenibacillus eucommiae]
MKDEISAQLSTLEKDAKVMLKLSIPTENSFCNDLMKDPHVVRIVVLSGGYSQAEANEKLAQNHGLIASFSRALSQDLTAGQPMVSSTGCFPNPFNTFMKPPLNKSFTTPNLS